jgi:hypothetical protein
MSHNAQFESSLLVPLTDETRPRFVLSYHAGVVILTRTVRALNLIRAECFEDLAQRRECAALLIGLRQDIQREAMREHGHE